MTIEYCTVPNFRLDGAALAVACSGIVPRQAVAAAKPNIIVISTDDFGYNETGFSSALNGVGTQFETPNLDALAQQSVVARQGYTAHSLCSPSRVGLLLGQYQHRIGMQDNLGESINDTQYGIPAGTTLMPQRLKNLGYTTGMIGKWHVGYAQGVNRPNDVGFDHFYGLLGSGRSYYSDFNQAHGIWKNNQFYEAQYANEGDHSKYDPAGGRYVTDAFGEEGVNFINQHANDADPFFLYMPFTASHIPFGVKQSDYAHFPNIVNSTTRTLAAMTYAFDRSVGDIVAAVNNNGIANNTIIVYVNDNGGNNFNDNRPFRGNKGLTYEGAIRMPFFVKMPGVSPGVYDKPISTYDLLPTFVNAAGGDASQIPTDGVDLKPYLNGTNTDTPHETLFWRNQNITAVRKGDWKFGSFSGGAYALYNVANDPGEVNDLLAKRPDKVFELGRDFTAWEASLPKPLPSGNPVNSFDHFVFRSDTTSFDNWSSANRWYKGGTTTPASFFGTDSYANLIIEFQTKNGGSYTANNNRGRTSGLPVMLNQLRFTGNFTDTVNRVGQSTGFALIFVKDLNGNAPRIQLDATSSGTGAKFEFRLDNPLLLFDDLELTGNGTQSLTISYGLQDFLVTDPSFGDPHNVTKTGTSKVIFYGDNRIRGQLRVNGGEISLVGTQAAFSKVSSVIIGSGGKLSQEGGSVTTPTFDNSAGGMHQFLSGELRVTDYFGNLLNQGGNYSPGASSPVPAVSTISGSLNQSAIASKLTMELAGTTPGVGYDQLTVGGSAALGGTLQIDLKSGFLQNTGDVYTLLNAAGGISGTFANTILPVLSGGRSWQVIYNPTSVQLMINATGGWNGVAGDYDRNGKVDAADYTLWKSSLGTSTQLLADGDGDGTVEMDDFQVWKANFGKTGPAAGSGSLLKAPIPEPDGLILCALATLIVKMKAERRRKLRWMAAHTLLPPCTIPDGLHAPGTARTESYDTFAMAAATGSPPS